MRAVVDLVDDARLQFGQHGPFFVWVLAATIDPEMPAQEHATHVDAVDRALLGREVCELALGTADVSAIRHYSFLLSSANLLVERKHNISTVTKSQYER